MLERTGRAGVKYLRASARLIFKLRGGVRSQPSLTLKRSLSFVWEKNLLGFLLKPGGRSDRIPPPGGGGSPSLNKSHVGIKSACCRRVGGGSVNRGSPLRPQEGRGVGAPRGRTAPRSVQWRRGRGTAGRWNRDGITNGHLVPHFFWHERIPANLMGGGTPHICEIILRVN